MPFNMILLLVSSMATVTITASLFIRYLQSFSKTLKKKDSSIFEHEEDEVSSVSIIIDSEYDDDSPSSSIGYDLRQRTAHNGSACSFRCDDKPACLTATVTQQGGTSTPTWQKMNESKSRGPISITENNFNLAVVSKPIKYRGLKGTKPLVTVDILATISRDSGDNNSFSKSSTPQTSSCNSASSSGMSTPLPSPRSADGCDVLSTMRLHEMKLDRVIGGGSFGQVWRGNWNGTPVAVKILSSSCQVMPHKVASDFEDEASMLAKLRHPNICMFLGVCTDPPNRAIVTELVSRGSLWDLLRFPGLFNSGHFDSEGDTQMSSTIPCVKAFHWPQWATRKVFEGTLRGLIYLHNQGIIHRDLKSANLLLDDGFNVKICDFGLAKMKDFASVMTLNVGTLQWMSPEVISGKVYDQSADIYSFGIIMWETLTGLCPFDNMTQIDIAMGVVQKGMRPPIPVACSNPLACFMQACWHDSAMARPSALNALLDLGSIFQYHNDCRGTVLW